MCFVHIIVTRVIVFFKENRKRLVGKSIRNDCFFFFLVFVTISINTYNISSIVEFSPSACVFL